MSFKMQGEINVLKASVKELQESVARLQHSLAIVGARPEFDAADLFKQVTALEERCKKQDLRYNALNARVSKQKE